MRKKAKAKAKATTRRKRTRDLGVKQAGTVKGGIAPSGPRAPAVKYEWSPDFIKNPPKSL